MAAAAKTQVQPIPDEWITVEEAAKLRGVAPRTIWRDVQLGRITTKKVRFPGERVYRTLVKRIDVLAVKTSDAQVRELQGGQRAALVAPAQAQLAAALAAIAPKPAAEAPPKPWLTLDQAAEYSGLPASFLARQIESGRLPALDILAGTKAAGRCWRVKPSDLDELPGVRCSPAE